MYMFNMTILFHAKKCTNAITTKMIHCSKIPKSAGQVGSPLSGPNFQTRIVQPIIAAINNKIINIGKNISDALSPNVIEFVSFNGGAVSEAS